MNIKKNIILLIIIILTTLSNVNATTNLGQLDDAKCLKPKEKQIGVMFGFYFTPYSCAGDVYDNSYSWENSIIPFSFTSITKNTITPNPMLLVPRFSLGYISRKGLNNRSEFSFGLIISSPTFVNLGVMGPDFLFYIGIKKNLFESKKFNLSYKINFGTEYTALPGLEIIIKNSLMFGSNRGKNNFSAIFSLRNTIGTILPFGSIMGPMVYTAIDFVYAALSPGLELNWSRNKESGFTSNVSLFCTYKLTVALYQIIQQRYTSYDYDDDDYNDDCLMPNYSGLLEIGMKFGWQGRFMTAE